MRERISLVLLIGIVLVLSGCAGKTTVKTTQVTPITQENAAIPDAELLDVGIYLFDPGIDDAEEQELPVFPEIRKAEAHYIPYHLMEAVQASSAWGAVRVVPNGQDSIDVTIKGKILISDGEQLRLAITVTDATGREWYEKEYEGLASRYSYSKRSTHNTPKEPFQSLYNEIANDMLIFRKKKMESAELREIRTIAELKFAKSFSPESFGEHLKETRNGQLEVVRLPSANDPMLQRIRLIRERDYLFVDTLQDYYGGFVKEMDLPYQEWRGNSYDEAMALKQMKKEAMTRKILGIASVIGGIAAANSNNASARAASTTLIATGAFVVKTGFDKSAEAEMHTEALIELGDSLEASIEPQMIDLEDRTITLTGTVDDQYQQWRALLQEIYRADTGL